jgi:cholesterol transport system auxiliary component
MRSPQPILRAAAAAALALGLGACVSLLPKADPVQLYEFEGVSEAAPAPAAAPAKATFDVMKGIGSFDRAAAGDRILTHEGGKVAYLADSRWVAPAVILFDQAVTRAFDANTGPARLLVRGQVGRAEHVLRLDVRDFEARYENGPKAAPVVLVRVRASLTGNDRNLVGEQMFEARVHAADNRVGAITEAFDEAVGEVLKELVTWTNTAGAPAAAS